MASAYTQSSSKRQKVRETSRSESTDYFQGIEKVEYNGMSSTCDTLNFRYYNHGERLHGRCIEDWLKFSVSFRAFKNKEKYGKSTHERHWNDNTNSIDNYKRQIKACFDFCQKLGIKYWTAFDTDLVPFSENFDEFKNNMDEMVVFIQDQIQRSHLKPLWISPDLHSHPRYTTGACTNNDTNTFIYAAVQIKKCMEMAHKLNAENFMIWPYREGYYTVYKTDVTKELKLLAKLFKMMVDYKERIAYRGQFLILPCNGGFKDVHNDFNAYIRDVSTCYCFLKYFNLDRFFKICAPPGYQFHMAQVYNLLGGITISNESKHALDNKTLTAMMKSVIDQDNTLVAGIVLNLEPRRDSTELSDLLLTYVQVMDMLAKCLRIAATIVSEQVFSKHVQQRYLSYYSGLGSRLLNGEVTLDECEDYQKKNSSQHDSQSSRAEHWDIVFQRYLDSCDHV